VNQVDRYTLAPSITALADVNGRVLLTGSHGAECCGFLALAAQVRAVVFHDAGGIVGGAGIAALPLLELWGVAAAAVSHRSARIGDPADMLARGIVSAANRPALELGTAVGGTVSSALEALKSAPDQEKITYVTGERGRRTISAPAGQRPLVLLDSASLVDPELDRGAVVVTGSHGGLVGGNPARAIGSNCYAAVFNDAGGGIDDAGYGRLPVLEDRGIAGITVSAESARIGDACSTLCGRISHVNAIARELGARVGELVGPVLVEWMR
jgi:hypothetical protein